jgi:hypothetical protein
MTSQPIDPVGGSSNGRTADSDSACLGSNPSPPTNSDMGAVSGQSCAEDL